MGFLIICRKSFVSFDSIVAELITKLNQHLKVSIFGIDSFLDQYRIEYFQQAWLTAPLNGSIEFFIACMQDIDVPVVVLTCD